MISLRRSSFASLCLLSFSASAFAVNKRDVARNAQALPKGSFDLWDHGKICEVLGQQKLEETLPAGSRVLNGVEYRTKKRVIGELDLVVIQNDIVTHVIEVKCMAEYGRAAHKADEQLDRFSQHVGKCGTVKFSLRGEELPCSVFENPDMILGKMSYSDAESAGFDFNFSMTRRELMQELRALGAN